MSCTVYLQNSIEIALLSNQPVTLPTSVTPPDRLGGALRDRELEIYRTYLLWHQELRSQGNNLARLTQAIHAANLDDRTLDPTNCLRVLSRIAIANREIALAIAKLEPKL